MTDHNLKWQKSAIEDLENTDLSIADIARKYGRSVDTIKKLRRFYNVTRKLPPRNRGAKKVADMVSLSSAHRAIGSRLTIYRASRSYSDVGAELGVSRYVVKLMEAGAHDFTLTQLLRVADVLDLPIEEIIKPIGISRSIEAVQNEHH